MATAEATKPDLPIEKKEKYTYGDYEELPEGAPYELIRGKLVMSPAPRLIHQRILQKLLMIFQTQASGAGSVFISPVDVYLIPDSALQPDLVFIATEREDIIGEARITGAPDLVVEVLSPSTAHYDLTTKKRLYEEHGVYEYWIVDPDEEMVEVFLHNGEVFMQHARKISAGSVTSTVIENLSVDVADIFKSR